MRPSFKESEVFIYAEQDDPVYFKVTFRNEIFKFNHKKVNLIWFPKTEFSFQIYSKKPLKRLHAFLTFSSSNEVQRSANVLMASLNPKWRSSGIFFDFFRHVTGESMLLAAVFLTSSENTKYCV